MSKQFKEHYDEVSSKVWDLYTNFVEATEQEEKDMKLYVAVELCKLGSVIMDTEDGFEHDYEDDNTDFENTSEGLYEELDGIYTQITKWIAKLSENDLQADKRLDMWRRIASRFGDIEGVMTEDYDDSKKCVEYRRELEHNYVHKYGEQDI